MLDSAGCCRLKRDSAAAAHQPRCSGDSHPLESAALSRRTPTPDMRAGLAAFNLADTQSPAHFSMHQDDADMQEVHIHLVFRSL